MDLARVMEGEGEAGAVYTLPGYVHFEHILKERPELKMEGQ